MPFILRHSAQEGQEASALRGCQVQVGLIEHLHQSASGVDARALEGGIGAGAYGEIDQSSQVVAMAQSIGATYLPLIYCVNPDEKGKVPGTVVQHDSAAVRFPKVSGWRRYVGRLIGKRAA
jgi:hypothetical protein